MTKNLDKEGLSSIVENYQLFYVDLWGVVHNGVSLHDEAIKALKGITKKGKDYILLTNAPRPNHAVKSFLEKLGMDREIREHVFTSGEAALVYLKRHLLSKSFFHIGPPRDFDLFKDFEKMKSNQIEKCDYILCTGLFDDHEDDLNYYRKILKKQISKKFIVPINKLTFNRGALEYVRNVKNRHRVVYLISGSHQILVDQVQERLKIFFESFGTSRNFNMVGQNKVQFINESLKIDNFDYFGNSKKDLPIWYHCKRIIYTNISDQLRTVINSSELEKIEIKENFN